MVIKVNSKVIIITNFLFKYRRKIKFNTTRQYSDNSPLIPKNLKILFFGADNFSLASLKALHEECKIKNRISAVGVVTSFKNPINPVRSFSLEKNLPAYKWPLDIESIKGYDLGVVVSFGHLIPARIISSFPLGMINVHASLLPRWRGAAPIIYALMKGDKKTGVSIMKIAPKHFDVGEILAQKEVPIKEEIFLPELHDRLSIEGANLLIETIQNVPDCLVNCRKQDESEVTYAPKIDANMTEVRWSKMTSEDVYNLYRALYSYKSLTTKFQGKLVKIVELRRPLNLKSETTQQNSKNPGEIVYNKEKNYLQVYCCRNGDFIEVIKLRLEGKKIITAREFNNGFLKKIITGKHFFHT